VARAGRIGQECLARLLLTRLDVMQGSRVHHNVRLKRL
jgi:hypothetical protein